MAQQPTLELSTREADLTHDDEIEEFLTWWDSLTAAEQLDIEDASAIADQAPPDWTPEEAMDCGLYAVEHRDELVPMDDGTVLVPPNVIVDWMVERGILKPAPRSTPRGRSSRRRRARTGATSGRQQRDVDRPRCACGCGEPLPQGKRKYLNDAHASRQRQRDYRAKRQLDTPPILTPEELLLWCLECPVVVRLISDRGLRELFGALAP